MGTSGYEIRHALLSEAREMLYEEGYAAREVELGTATFENRPPKTIPAPVSLRHQGRCRVALRVRAEEELTG